MSENISLNEGIRQFENDQRTAGLKLTAKFLLQEKSKTKFESIYFSKPKERAKFDYFK